jgi:hypothetical protein
MARRFLFRTKKTTQSRSEHQSLLPCYKLHIIDPAALEPFSFTKINQLGVVFNRSTLKVLSLQSRYVERGKVQQFLLFQMWGWGQGDEISLRKNRPKCSPTHFCVKILYIFFCGKNSSKNLGYFSNILKNAQSKR